MELFFGGAKYLGTNLRFQESVQNGYLARILAGFKYNLVTSFNVQIILVYSKWQKWHKYLLKVICTSVYLCLSHYVKVIYIVFRLLCSGRCILAACMVSQITASSMEQRCSVRIWRAQAPTKYESKLDPVSISSPISVITGQDRNMDQYKIDLCKLCFPSFSPRSTLTSISLPPNVTPPTLNATHFCGFAGVWYDFFHCSSFNTSITKSTRSQINTVYLVSGLMLIFSKCGNGQNYNAPFSNLFVVPTDIPKITRRVDLFHNNISDLKPGVFGHLKQCIL